MAEKKIGKTTSQLVSLADEDGVKEVLVSTVLDLGSGVFVSFILKFTTIA